MPKIKKQDVRTFASYEDLVEATNKVIKEGKAVDANVLRISKREDSFSKANRRGQKLIELLSR